MILKVLNVLEYRSISPNRTLKMIVEFCNLKFLSIRSNVKRVASSALYGVQDYLKLSELCIRKATPTKFRVSCLFSSILSIRCLNERRSRFQRVFSQVQKTAYQKRVANFSISPISICEVERVFYTYRERK